MILIFRGGTNMDAMDVQQEIEALTPVEHDRNQGEEKGWRYRLIRGVDDAEVNRIRMLQTEYISPNARRQLDQPISMDMFPANHQFGNGVTCNAGVTLTTGERVRLSWCVLPDPKPPNIDALIPAIATIVEGV